MKIILILITFITLNSHGSDDLWTPYKDELFTPDTIAIANENCNISLYDYNEIDHVNGRDCAKENGFHFPMAQPKRIKDVSKLRRERKDIPGVDATWEIGRSPNEKINPPKCAIVWCHGAVESKSPHHLGARDSNFGANNNRLMNLAIQKNCVYYSPNFRGRNGYYAIQSLIDYLKSKNFNEVFISASSAGAAALNIAASNPKNTDILAGLIYNGTYASPINVSRTPAFKSGVPIVFSHGANDKYQQIRDDFIKVQEMYPPSKTPYNNTWLQVFKNGGHGTPIRMIDWRHTLNWARTQNKNRKKNIDVLPLSNEGVNCASDYKNGLDDFLNDTKKISEVLSTENKKIVSCNMFKKGAKYGLPITRELKRTKGCWPFIKNTQGKITASINQINCVAKKGENIPGKYSYALKNIPIREVRTGETLEQRVGCHKQAKKDY